MMVDELHPAVLSLHNLRVSAKLLKRTDVIGFDKLQMRLENFEISKSVFGPVGSCSSVAR